MQDFDIKAIREFNTLQHKYLSIKKENGKEYLEVKKMNFLGRLWMYLGFSNASMKKIVDYVVRNKEAFQRKSEQTGQIDEEFLGSKEMSNEDIYRVKLYDKISSYSQHFRNKHFKYKILWQEDPKKVLTPKQQLEHKQLLKASNVLSYGFLYPTPKCFVEEKIVSFVYENKYEKADLFLEEMKTINSPHYVVCLEKVNNAKAYCDQQN